MNVIKSLIKKIISASGYTLYSNKITPYNSNTMRSGLERMQQLGIAPSSVIDLGAARGTWTKMAMEIWPAAKYELVEPLSEQLPALTALQAAHANVRYHLAVAGEAVGEILFNVSSDLYGSGVYGQEGADARKVPVVTIDEIVKDTSGTLLIKFDTHGYELPILKGAQEALKRTSLLVIEVYGFRISPTCLLFHELSAYLYDAGFRLIDLVDISRRPVDNAFWQADAFYIRKDHPLFEKNFYSA